MVKEFSVAKKQFADSLADEAFNEAVKEWLDSLSIGDTSSYTIQIEHKSGFWIIVIISEA